MVEKLSNKKWDIKQASKGTQELKEVIVIIISFQLFL